MSLSHFANFFENMAAYYKRNNNQARVLAVYDKTVKKNIKKLKNEQNN